MKNLRGYRAVSNHYNLNLIKPRNLQQHVENGFLSKSKTVNEEYFKEIQSQLQKSMHRFANNLEHTQQKKMLKKFVAL